MGGTAVIHFGREHVHFITQAGLHILRGHEAIEAETLEGPGGVCALSSVTDVQVLLTLVNIW